MGSVQKNIDIPEEWILPAGDLECDLALAFPVSLFLGPHSLGLTDHKSWNRAWAVLPSLTWQLWSLDVSDSIIMWTISFNPYTCFIWFFSLENSSRPSNVSTRAATVGKETEEEFYYWLNSKSVWCCKDEKKPVFLVSQIRLITYMFRGWWFLYHLVAQSPMLNW